MDTVRYRAFVTAAELGTVKDAAEELGYTPSGVSQLIHALEDELDMKLLIRSRTGVTLTAGGEMLLPIARGILAQEEQLYQTAAEINGLLTGRLTVAAHPSIAINWMPELIKTFRGSHPGVEIILREGSWDDMFRWVEERSIDLAFIAEAAETPYEFVPLIEDDFVAVLPLSHPLAGAEKYPLSRLSQEILALTEISRDHELVPKLRAIGVPWKTKIAAKEPHSILMMVAKDMCMTLTNRMNTARWEELVRILPLDPPLSETIGVLFPAADRLSPAAKQFLRLAEETYGTRG